MAINFLDGLNIKKKAPDVARQLFDNIDDMVAWADIYLPDVYECNVKDTGKRYRYNVSNSVDPVLGKWREVSSGDTDLTNYYTKNEIDNTVVKPVSDKANANEASIGKMSDLVVTSWTDLVTAINSLYNSFMTSLVYTVNDEGKKVLRITYRNGLYVDVDISAIVTDSEIGDLKNVDTTGIKDGELLAYTVSTNKFVPKTIDLAGLLSSANTYTDTKVAESEKSNAISCDKKPTYDAFTDTVTYEQNHIQKTEPETTSWFYYKNAEGTVIQTRWISGTEFTIDVSSINLDDYVKTEDVSNTYTGEDTETKTDIATIASLDALKTIINGLLSAKVNTADIVDELASEASDAPLSANQGRILDGKITSLNTLLEGKLSIHHDVSDEGKVPTVDASGNLILKAGSGLAENIAYENEGYPDYDTVKKAIDGIFAKIDYVKPEIKTFTMSCDATNEIGAKIASITFNWATNKTITNQTLTDCTLADASVRTADYDTELSTTKTFTLSIADGQNTATKSLTVAFRNKIYWGGASLPDDLDSSFILGLSKSQFATAYKGSYTMNVGSGQYGFIAFPKTFGQLSSVWIGGFEVSVEHCGDISFTNASGGVSVYSVYRTGKSGLGTITMEIK